MGVSTYVWLGIISCALSLITFSVSLKMKNHISEIAAVSVLTLIGLLFNDEDGFTVRIKVVAILLVFYVVFYFLWSIIRMLYSFIVKNSNKNKEKEENKENISITLPLNYPYTVDSKFIEDIPANVESVVYMNEQLCILTNTFIKKFNKAKDDNQRGLALKTYFLGICYQIAALFDDSTRVHVRILKDGQYKKFIATYHSKEEYHSNITTMSLDNKMIKESYDNNCSLIKTLNPTLHEKATNHKWKNYLMFALPQITHEGRPVFSLGISVTRKKNDLFYFLNYCEIESIIGRHFEKIIEDNSIALLDFIENFYFPPS